jgi:hypothetical protein
MTATTRRQSGLLGIPPLPPLPKKTMPKSNSGRREDVVRVEQQQEGSSSTKRRAEAGTLSRTTRTDSLELAGCDQKPLGKGVLKRRRSLPCPPTHPSLPAAEGHFLEGVALESCHDLLSIPDPPSPPLVTRRASGAFLPLRDLSNEEGRTAASPHQLLLKRGSPLVSTRKSKRSRLSLPLVPSPIVTKQQLSDSRRAKASSSMLEPCGIRQGGDSLFGADSSNGSAGSTFQTFKQREQLASYTIPTMPQTGKLREVRRLVHAYTNLPEEKRWGSNEALTIQQMSGYPLVPSVIPGGAVSESEKLQRRSSVISSLSSRLKLVEACKLRDARMAEDVTECRAQKVRREGYGYTHITTGRAVPPEEFEQRYLCMIREVSSIRSKSWGDYFANLSTELKTNLPKYRTEKKPTSPFRANAEALVAGKAVMVDSVSAKDEIGAMELAETSLEAVAAEDDGFPVTHQKHDATPANVDEAASSTAITKAKVQRVPSPTSPDMLLPFPARDETSTNPLIAGAEQKLWTAIDQALACYSQEVLEIQAAVHRSS